MLLLDIANTVIDGYLTHATCNMYWCAEILFLVSIANAAPLIITGDAPGSRDAQVENPWPIQLFIRTILSPSLT